ncbi:MAG TPA: hypothetical protein DEV93_10605 [Chloroflexi bacterium]|jgi:crotonobetainyl-CoA:carnitine CoA-transferase CaiB-like acyl-CoA transferase|nr:hypothetical protein [Chloroflexota bacterium]
MSSSQVDSPSLLGVLGQSEEQLPLTGIRVLDLTRVWAGPFATRHLADLGAEVVRLEHPNARGPAGVRSNGGLRGGIYPGGQPAPEPWNRQGAVNKLNRNKLSLCLDVGKPGGLDILRQLIVKSDVLIENFSARVMPNWDLDWESLHALNSRLVYLSMPGFGRTGPRRDFVAVGAMIEPHAGLSSLMAYDESQPYRTQATYSDPLIGVVAAWAVVAALLRRQQTGEGSLVDLAHTEATTRLIGAEIIASQGEAWAPTYGNRDPVFIPQGVFPCRGDDAWIAITVQTEAAWRGLCRVLERDDWSADTSLGTSVGRAHRQDELEEGIAEWTAGQDKLEAMEALQKAGVAAGAVLTNQEMVENHVLAPDFFVPIEENWGETVPYPRFPAPIEGMERHSWHRAPRLGEHNRLVLMKLLGKTDKEINELEQAGTIAHRPGF